MIKCPAFGGAEYGEKKARIQGRSTVVQWLAQQFDRPFCISWAGDSVTDEAQDAPIGHAGLLASVENLGAMNYVLGKTIHKLTVTARNAKRLSQRNPRRI